jgi:tetratricopeptide (TPR) repeat protein
VDKAYEYFAAQARIPEVRANLEEMSKGSMFAMFDGYQAIAIQTATIGLEKSEDVQGTVARVSGAVQYDGGYTGTFQATLIQEGSTWRLINMNVAAPPQKVNAAAQASSSAQMDSAVPRELYDQAIAACQQNEYATALGLFNKILEMDSKNADTYSLRADCFLYLGRPDQALSDYSRAIELDPAQYTSYASRAFVLAHLGHDLDQALADVNRALEKFPERADYLRTRAFVQYTKGNYAAAIEDAQRALKGGDRIVYYTLGLIHEALGHKEQAIENYRNFLIAVPETAETQEADDARTRLKAPGITPP